MKQLVTAFSMCQTMFCRIPFPLKKWEEAARPYLLLFLPLVGLEIGALWLLTDILLRHLGIPAPIYGFAMTAVPFLLTGGIHLDGFMDVADAIGSWRELEKRRAILKDSLVGAVAVIWVIFLMLGYFAVFSSVTGKTQLQCLLLVPVVSRCCSALAVTGLKPMSTSQYAQQKKPKAHIAVLLVMLCACLGAGFLLCGKYGAALLGCLAGYGFALRHAYRSLEGMNGDISGYALTVGELCAVAVYALI